VLGQPTAWPSPQGGAGRLAEALVSAVEAHGGRCRTGARVVRVQAGGGRVRGVEIEGGERVEARIVLCDLVPAGLLAVAGDVLPPRYRDKLVEFRPGPGTFKVDWALDGPIPWTAPEAQRAGTVHVGGDADAVSEAVRRGTMAGELPERPFLLLGQQALHDPARAPDGKGTAWAYTHIDPDQDWGAQRDRFADTIEAHIERYAPGFRDRVLARHVMDPPELERRDANLVGGDVGGGSYTLDQLVFRPVPSISPYRTALRGLYIGSAGTFPGGAVHGVCGAAAARAAILDARLRRV
jgi:phytoene dehydrogenase-like protein